ncbi:MAG: hypothetical protein ACK5U7_05830 [Bacteroidota bacterium]|jgi:hypothetical protein
MNLTWGFILVFVYVLFPGLIIRRLYFYGDFSKQFGHHEPILKILIYALIPGLINACLGFWLYAQFFSGITTVQIVSTLNSIKVFLDGKGIMDPSTFAYVQENGLKLSIQLYILALILGGLSGPLIRNTGLDLRFKLFRYKNTWFYLFNGLHQEIKRNTYKKSGLSTILSPNRKFVFANADILLNIKDEQKLILYSGIVVDYELDAINPQELSKVILFNAKKYTYFNTTKRQKSEEIPGSLFVVDCKNLINVNLTYIFDVYEKIWNARIQLIARFWTTTLGLLFLLAFIPIVVFQLNNIELEAYKKLFEIHWAKRLIVYLSFIQFAHLINIFTIDINSNEYRFANGPEWIFKIIIAIFFCIVSWQILK